MKRLVPAIALATLYSCTPLWAETSSAPRSVTVHFEDLNINSARGATLLYQRIAHAAENVCGDRAPQRSLKFSSLYASCMRDAIGDAVARVNHPTVTEYAAARGIVPVHALSKVKLARKE
jgi:UrcA family protein